jgi:uncharacterized protein (TIGR00156 family)
MENMKQKTAQFKKWKTLLFMAVFTGIFGIASAQYTGPGSEAKTHKVKDVLDAALKLDRKDTMVKMKGFVVEKIKDEEYWFEDETGKIKIEIDDKHLPDSPFDENTELIITGEVDYDLLEGTEIEVEKKVEFAANTLQEKNSLSTEND